MGGKSPISIITDQDAAMRAAIKREFPDAVHRNCLFHIMTKAEQKGGNSFARDKELARCFYDVIYNSLGISEFKRLWNSMMDKYKVRHIKYFNHMYEIKDRFVPVYFKHCFFPFIQSTARSEGTNGIFKDNIGPTSSAITVLQEYDRIVQGMDHKCNEQDKNKSQDIPNLYSEYVFERQARELYNIKIFYKFQQIVKDIGKYMIDEEVPGQKYVVYKSPEHAQQDFRARKYLVVVHEPSELYHCICCKFQKDGIVCAHVLRTVVRMNKSSLPEKYFIDRWRPNNKKHIRNTEAVQPEELIQSNRLLRYNILSRKCVQLASDASQDVERYKYVIGQLDKLSKETNNIPIRQMPNLPNNVDNNHPSSSAISNINRQRSNCSSAENLRPTSHQDSHEQTDTTLELVSRQSTVQETSRTQQQTFDALAVANNTTSTTNDTHEQVSQQVSLNSRPTTNIAATTSQPSSTVQLSNPPVLKAKGRPSTGGKKKRLMPIAEIVRKTNKITCSHCQSNEHNIRTCDQRDKDPVPKKKQKQSHNRTTKAKDNEAPQQATSAMKKQHS
ncbi:hypothetical protein ACP70R_001723 [Stipagrostis hirtigluma subsp. patula]